MICCFQLLLSTSAFKFNLRRYTVGTDAFCAAKGSAGQIVRYDLASGRELGRGLHSSTFQLNLSAFYGIGGARRGCVARFKGVFRVCMEFSGVRHGSS